MNLFLDANTWLSFYHFTSDDLEELKKVSVLIDQNRLTLHFPDQVLNEFRRNRDAKIADAIARFKSDKLSKQFPQICKGYKEYDTLRAAIRQYEAAKSQLLEKLTADYGNEELKADRIVEELFEKANHIQTTDEILALAKRRHDLGNPPGKRGSYGDAVNWECLLAEVPHGEDLLFISGDRDYCSQTSEEEFSPFLSKEWGERKESRIVFFKRLSDFFQDQFPEIRLATELEKELLIRDLINSPNFASTRIALRKLVRFSDFTDAQINDIVTATLSNNQINWIAGDSDINQYLRRLVAGRESRVDPDKLNQYQKLLEGEHFEEGDDDIPF